MKIVHAWLRELVDVPADVDAVAAEIALRGFEVAGVERGVIDFEDVLLLMVGILREHDEVARAVRSQYRHFVVDEYQDVNRLQQTLLDLWLGGRDDICVVGDPAQTIYSFAGARADYLREFPAKFPGTTSIELVRNYRSSPEVVAAANTPLAGTASRISGNRRTRAG